MNADFGAWIGRRETATDVVSATPYAAMSALLDRAADRPAPGAVLPPLWHWLYFLPLDRQSDLGVDGAARRGGFLPPVSLPRRMWAGGQFRFHAPLRIGDEITRSSTVEDVAAKSGRSGELVFVRVRHEIRRTAETEPAITEHHDIVYRGAAAAAAPPHTADTDAPWRREIVPTDVLLFRYSALTFNGYRIHYDRPYATGTESYPGLVVHGPLIATLLLDLLHQERPACDIVGFRFKAIRPTFDTHPFVIRGRPLDDGRTVRLWAHDHEGWLTMDATADITPKGP